MDETGLGRGSVSIASDALSGSGEDPTPSLHLVATALRETGVTTAGSLEEDVACSKTTIRAALSHLEGLGLAERSKKNDHSGGGRPEHVWTATDELDVEVQGEGEDWDMERKMDVVVCALARIHYRKGISSAKASQIARETPLGSRGLAQVLKRLTINGVVEQPGPNSGTTRYRLVGCERYTPFYPNEGDRDTEGRDDG
jgi:predicted transcriptional regulator